MGWSASSRTFARARAFEYTSAAVLRTPIGTMHGEYLMLADDGHTFYAPIPVFRLLGPGATLH